MRTEIARPTTAEETIEKVRPALVQMVRGEEYVTGSRMVAYANVGRAIGKSPSWVRKLVGRQNVALRHFEFLNIVRAYGALCERIEAATAAERLRAAQLRSEADAAAESAGGLVGGPAGAPVRGTSEEAASLLTDGAAGPEFGR